MDLDCMWTITPSFRWEQMQCVSVRVWASGGGKIVTYKGWRTTFWGEFAGVMNGRGSVPSTRSKNHSPGTLGKWLMLLFLLHLYHFCWTSPLLLLVHRSVWGGIMCERSNKRMMGGNCILWFHSKEDEPGSSSLKRAPMCLFTLCRGVCVCVCVCVSVLPNWNQ